MSKEQEQKWHAEFHEWNEDMSGNANQEICRYRMQGFIAARAIDAQRIADLEAEIESLSRNSSK